MNLNAIIKTAETGLKIGGKFVVKNLPTILTALATIGVIDGVVRTAKKAPEAKEAFQKVKDDWEALPEEQKQDKAVYVWRLIKVGARYYGVIALEIGGVIVCIWSANSISLKRLTAALVGLKTTSDYAKDLEDQIKKDGGDGRLTKYKDEINARKIREEDIPPVPVNPANLNHTIGETPIWDPASRSWIVTTVQNVLQARDKVRNDLFDQLTNGGEYRAFVPHVDLLNYMGVTPSGPASSEDSIHYLGYGAEILSSNTPLEKIREEVERACDISFTAVVKDQCMGALCMKYAEPPKYRFDYE